jgi:hypothetical protein
LYRFNHGVDRHTLGGKSDAQKPKNYDAKQVKSFGVIIIDPILLNGFFPPTTESGHHLTGLTQTKTANKKKQTRRDVPRCAASEMSQT